MRRGIASKDNACGSNVMGQLGLQQTTMGRPALLGDSGVVHRRKTALVTTWFATMAAVAGTLASQRDAVVRRAWFGCRWGSWKRGIIVLHPGGDIINESATRSTVAEVARCGGDCDTTYVRSGFGGSTLPDDVRCCNGTTAVCPAWRWSSRCGAVRSSRFPIDLEP